MTQPAPSQIMYSLLAWQKHTGQRLPLPVERIADIEIQGSVVDLETGDVSRVEPVVVEFDPHAWLADLEAAGDGEVTVQWSCRPEDWDFERNCPKGQA